MKTKLIAVLVFALVATLNAAGRELKIMRDGRAGDARIVESDGKAVSDFFKLPHHFDTRTNVDVRAEWQGASASVYVVALSCWNCDVNEIYAVVTTEGKTRLTHVGTED